MKPGISIAIDGFSKCGKSTLAKSLAKKFGLLYIDSGALYRLAALILLNKRDIRSADLRFFNSVDIDHDGSIFCFGKDLTREIGSEEVNDSVSFIAQNLFVRNAVKEWIKNKSGNESVAMDGRDIGTNVLPDAKIKLFLYASIDYRANNWRKRQLKLYGYIDPILEKKEIDNITKRDYDDLYRSIDPLKCADDAILFDVEQCSLEQIYSFVCLRIDGLMNDRL